MKSLIEDDDENRKDEEKGIGTKKFLFLLLMFVIVAFLISGFTFLSPEYMPPKTEEEIRVIAEHTPENPVLGENLTINATVKHAPSNYSVRYEIRYYEEGQEIMMSFGEMTKIGKDKFQYKVNLEGTNYRSGMVGQYTVDVLDEKNEIITESGPYSFTIQL